jgi:pyruvate-formate lyase-activating enzyme
MKTTIDLDIGRKTFASGLLPELIGVLRRSRPGDLIAVVGDEASLAPELQTWCRFTGNSLLQATVEGGRRRWVFRRGALAPEQDNPPVRSRVWLYTNFDCNLRCDYCCVRSSPTAPRRPLGLARVRRIAAEAAELGVGELLLTGGEPFLLPDIGEMLLACASAAPTTVLTNGMLFAGRRLESLRRLPRERVTLQISLDSPTPERHDRHRGTGTWRRAWRGIERARAEGFRVRLAATVADDSEAQEFERFLDAQQIRTEDRVIRRVALRGFAAQGLALARVDVVPEITITNEGVYWHPVGADDADMFLTAEIFPLADAFTALRRALDQETDHRRRLATIFNCA